MSTAAKATKESPKPKKADAAADKAAPEKKKRGAGAMAVAQRIGRSLMLPVAVLPAAALLVRLGNKDMLGRDSFPEVITKIASYMSAGGNALLSNMALLFAVGVAIGFAKKSDGSTALAAVTGYLVFKEVLATFTDSNLPKVAAVADGKIVMNEAPVNAGVLGGVVMGLVVALLYQRYSRKKLPLSLIHTASRSSRPSPAWSSASSSASSGRSSARVCTTSASGSSAPAPSARASSVSPTAR